MEDLRAPMTVFDVLKQDMDDVIMLINYYIERGADRDSATPPQTGGKKREERIRVNDKTATGGWW